MVWSFAFVDGIGHTVGHEMVDGDIDRIEYVDTTRELKTWGGGFKPGQLYRGRAIKPDHVPTKVIRGGKRYGIPDCVHGVNMMFVNDRFCAVVERLEPGVHQYFPMQMLWKDGSLAQDMYMFNICNRLDTMSREKATAQLDRIWLPETGTFVFSLSRIGNHHIWVDKHVHAGKYMSDAMHDALLEAGITGIQFGKRNTTEAL